jgi:FkbM family methyltransferase
MEPELLARLEQAFTEENLGRAALQNVYALLVRVGITGMNMMPRSLEDSGEILAFSLVRTELLRRRAALPYVILDVGASTGEVSLAFKQIFGDAAVIHAFEPSAHAFDLLSRRSAELGWEQVVLNHLALGAEPGEATLYAKTNGDQTGSLYHRQASELANAGLFRETVQIRTLDDYCLEAGIDHIDLLKMDVEGHELAVLQGASRMLEAGSVNFIQFEFGGANIDSRTFFRDFWTLLNPRYEIRRILRDGLMTIDKYDEILEIFEWQNFLAVRRS